MSNEFKPMETAPRDGRKVELRVSTDGRSVGIRAWKDEAWMDDTGCRWSGSGYDGWRDIAPASASGAIERLCTEVDVMCRNYTDLRAREWRAMAQQARAELAALRKGKADAEALAEDRRQFIKYQAEFWKAEVADLKAQLAAQGILPGRQWEAKKDGDAYILSREDGVSVHSGIRMTRIVCEWIADAHNRDLGPAAQVDNLIAPPMTEHERYAFNAAIYGDDTDYDCDAMSGFLDRVAPGWNKCEIPEDAPQVDEADKPTEPIEQVLRKLAAEVPQSEWDALEAADAGVTAPTMVEFRELEKRLDDLARAINTVERESEDRDEALATAQARDRDVLRRLIQTLVDFEERQLAGSGNRSELRRGLAALAAG